MNTGENTGSGVRAGGLGPDPGLVEIDIHAGSSSMSPLREEGSPRPPRIATAKIIAPRVACRLVNKRATSTT
jgi:hypothetical protein